MKLCIDAGHGLSNQQTGVYDPGAVAAGVAEADITLLWALAGRYILRLSGIETWLTRDDADDRAPLSERVNQARQAGCTHYLSLHCNSSTAESASGTETYYRDVADRELGSIAHVAALSALVLPDRGLRREGKSQHSRLAVFEFDGPCSLVELGFISNMSDRRRLLERDRRIAFWQRVGKALKEVMA